MYIRQTQTANKATGEHYITYRLVTGKRVDGKVRQITLLNLGRHFPFPKEEWPLLCQQIEMILSGQLDLLQEEVAQDVKRAAHHYAGRLVSRSTTMPQKETTVSEKGGSPVFEEVDVDSQQLTQPRSVGVEHVGLYALSTLGLIDKLLALGVNGPMRAAMIGSIIGRMALPGSERATCQWLQTQSALGELIDFDFQAMPLMRLYRASDLLMKHRAEIETHLFGSVRDLFGLEETVTLYDLTNTYCEGGSPNNPKAQRGRSKEKRSDCPLITLGLVLDGSGFVRRSQTFAGNVSEGTTLSTMLRGLQAPTGALIIMDAGIATEANIAWLVEQGYRYLVVQRGGARQFDMDHAVSIETAGHQTLHLQKQMSQDGKEALLYCHSEQREHKEKAMNEQWTQRFEAGLKKMAEGLTRPRGEKRHDRLLERLGRLKEKSGGVSPHYRIEFALDETGKQVKAITWEKLPITGTKMTHPGVYCLRSNELTWDAEKLWRTYTLLTDLESVFRSLKSELGLRPVFHSKEERADGHLFITVIAYQCVQLLRQQLKKADIKGSWTTLRDTLSVQRRVTSTFKQRDGRTLNVRKSTVAEPDLAAIYSTLHMDPLPGGTKKLMT